MFFVTTITEPSQITGLIYCILKAKLKRFVVFDQLQKQYYMSGTTALKRALKIRLS